MPLNKLAMDYLKLLFPHIKVLFGIDRDKLKIFYLKSAHKKRGIIRKQL